MVGMIMSSFLDMATRSPGPSSLTPAELVLVSKPESSSLSLESTGAVMAIGDPKSSRTGLVCSVEARGVFAFATSLNARSVESVESETLGSVSTGSWGRASTVVSRYNTMARSKKRIVARENRMRTKARLAFES